jgi:hypothetical protein
VRGNAFGLHSRAWWFDNCSTMNGAEKWGDS